MRPTQTRLRLGDRKDQRSLRIIERTLAKKKRLNRAVFSEATTGFKPVSRVFRTLNLVLSNSFNPIVVNTVTGNIHYRVPEAYVHHIR